MGIVDNNHKQLEVANRTGAFIGVFDTKIKGVAFAVGKLEPDTLVFNFGNKSCMLLTENGCIDLRNYDFSKIKCVEICGNKFIREQPRRVEIKE